MWRARIPPVPLGVSLPSARPFDAAQSALSIDLNTRCQEKLILEGFRGGALIAVRPSRLYSPAQRARRDASPWTLVQGILAPVQFVICLASVALIGWFLVTGEAYDWATASVVLKTLALYAIMITGAIWEREVFGQYLFAEAFFWEDVVSMLVLALHTIYLAALWTGAVDGHDLIRIALAAYAAYLVNAGQFLLKLRAARREGSSIPAQAARLEVNPT